MRRVMNLFLLALLAAGPALAQTVPPKKEGTTRVALLGCLRQFEPSPGLYRYIEARPDLCLWLGDNMYADTQDDPDVIRRCYAAVAARPEFQWLCANVPYAVTWDDHDYGDNNVYKDYPLKEESREIYLDFWKLRDRIPAARQGIYYAELYEFEGRRLHVVMTDTRWNRDDPGPESDMLGEEQWAWLEDQLAIEADLHIIVSGSQFLLTRESGSETWDEYPAAMARFTDLVRRSRAERVVFVTGDQHYAEVARKRNALDFDFVELEFCGINQIEDPEYNPLRVSTVASSVHSCAFIDIQWEADKHEVPHLLFSVYNALNMQAEVLYRVNLDELALDFGHEAPLEFVEEAEVALHNGHPNLALRYTTDGTAPTTESPRYEAPFAVRDTTTVRYALFDPDGWARSDAKEATLRRVEPMAAAVPGPLAEGLRVQCYEGAFERIPEFDALVPVRDGVAHDFDVATLGTREDGFALRFEGYLRVPRSGMYAFTLKSDDGSRLILHDTVVVDNDGSHSARARRGRIALAAGLHPIRIEYFEDYMGQELSLRWTGPGITDGPVPPEALGHAAE